MSKSKRKTKANDERKGEHEDFFPFTKTIVTNTAPKVEAEHYLLQISARAEVTSACCGAKERFCEKRSFFFFFFFFLKRNFTKMQHYRKTSTFTKKQIKHPSDCQEWFENVTTAGSKKQKAN